MIKKEFRDIIKPTLVIMFVLLMIPFLNLELPGFFGKEIPNLSTRQGIHQIFGLYFIASIITIEAGILGSGTFRSEYKDNAFEYLFSSPISVSRVLIFKAIPRLIVLIISMIIYILNLLSHTTNTINSLLEHSIFLNPKFFIFWIIFIFFISFLPSIFRQKNWIAITSLFTLISIFVFPVAIKKILLTSGLQLSDNYNTKIFTYMFGMIIVFLISIIAFFISYRSFDLKESFFEGKRYSMISLSTQVILITISIFVFIK